MRCCSGNAVASRYLSSMLGLAVLHISCLLLEDAVAGGPAGEQAYRMVCVPQALFVFHVFIAACFLG